MRINDNKNVKKMPRKYKKIKPIGKGNYNSMNTIKGTLVISPSVLNHDLNVNQNE